ncbi:PREDICTED: cation channel sperm-associated protein subunit gamma [Miniopterus natalensis]|uniref:cation channel sperm-associated protein subunit gamma n=1 Tax=Miniopterus natalensis TaxID=291302 RepID=UPI0007A6BE32|nr:PREDICTED: cation channel sperm-associated protein subunit gamma [Miniopterus natalensis]
MNTAAGPECPRFRVPWALWSLLVLLSPGRLWAIHDEPKCTWQVVLNKFQTVGKNDGNDPFFDQELGDTVNSLFDLLVAMPFHEEEYYMGFPYYLKINYSCVVEASEAQVRKGFLTGLKPMVLVTFQPSVNFNHWKLEQLQIEMEAAPLRSKEHCNEEEMCTMSWYTPMPLKNGSVVMYVDISSNGLGPFIPSKRFQVNINGFLKRGEDKRPKFTVGTEHFNLRPQYFVKVPSRPLWYTVGQAPVLILGEIPKEKYILLTDSSFKDIFLVELSIDSCWVGSFYCRQSKFTATIYDTIATESTLFIRQNQLVYYFTGTYITLHGSHNYGSESWVRVLSSECIKRLCPVDFHGNGSEYIIALTAGKHEGYLHFGTISDGKVSFEMLPRKQSVCRELQVTICSITWAIYIENEQNLLLLVEIEDIFSRKSSRVVRYNLITDYLAILYTIPEFIPDAQGLEFLMILGTESYTTLPMVPKGMSYNPFSHLLFIWGNFLLQSYDNENFIFLADFPVELSIKYLVNSFRGEIAIVTETEEIWFLLEGSYRVYKLFPSRGWEAYSRLELMHQSTLYTSKETMVTLFYEDRNLYQLVYLENNPRGELVKRLVPVEHILMYHQLSSPIVLQQEEDHVELSFINFCPFTKMHLQNLPKQQIYSRQERYRVRPPRVLHHSAFHSQNSLAIYQGLVYYLLWLHSKYDKVGTWWQGADYYYYLASNWQTAGKVHIDMDNYHKVHDFKTEHQLPERIYLDKGNSYSFSIFLNIRGYSFKSHLNPAQLYQAQSSVDLGVVVADPGCIEVIVKQEVFVNRNSVLFQITLRDKRFCFDQAVSGHNYMKTSMLVKVVGSTGYCFQKTDQGPRMQGNLMVPVLIGCPPGKRLAFDITYTLDYSSLKNKHYFDCVRVDPEMPCFLFRNMFYPFFLIQDLVTGDSGSFQDSYVLKVVGGGPTLDTIREYSEEEIYRFNSPLDNTDSLIWMAKNSTVSKNSPFSIMSHQNLGIEWLCLENSPCHDTVPQSIFAPEFFFKLLVSNKGVDKSTYCDYQFTFLLHVHGLPLSAKRAIFIFMVTAGVFLSLVCLYITFCLLLPLMLKACDSLRWKINNVIASDSYYTYSSSSKATLENKSSSVFKASSKAEPEGRVRKSLA